MNQETNECSFSWAAPNNRLKLPARGRSVAKSLRRTRAAAYPERYADTIEG